MVVERSIFITFQWRNDRLVRLVEYNVVTVFDRPGRTHSTANIYDMYVLCVHPVGIKHSLNCGMGRHRLDGIYIIGSGDFSVSTRFDSL